MTGVSAPEGNVDMEKFGSELTGSGVDTSGPMWTTLWGAFGCLATTSWLMIGYGAWHDSALSKLGKLSLVVSSLALGVALFSVGIDDPLLSTVISVTALVMGVISLGITIHEFIGDDMPENTRISAWLSLIINTIALVISGTGTYLSIDNLVRSEE